MDIERIWRDVEFLAACPRPAESNRLAECRRYCRDSLSKAGWEAVEDSFEATDAAGGQWRGVNLVASTPGAGDLAHPILVVGAHLDSKPETPGADDNASAVAVLLELARQLPITLPGQPPFAVELAVFDLEELGMLGGARHAEVCRRSNRALTGMVSLEMLGYRSSAPGSQQVPEPLRGRYPETGDFIALVGNQNSTEMIEAWATAFRETGDLPAETLQVPDNGMALPPSRLSDHSPFWDAGYPALMITDTSFMRNPHYHLPSDTPETLDREFLHKVARGVHRAVTRFLLGSVD